MTNLTINITPQAKTKLANYPNHIKAKLEYLKDLVTQVAEETKEVQQLEVTLKWGEPSFVTKHGSTLRMDWKEKTPHQYAMYFQCSSRLVDTFRMVFKDRFQFEGSRAIIFQLDDEIPVPELKECIKAALRYHKVKDEITLGI